MAKELVQARVEAIRRLVRRRMARPLTRALEKSSARDIVDACAHLTNGQRLFLMDQIPEPAVAGEVLVGLPQQELDAVVASLSFDDLLRWLEEIEPDDLFTLDTDIRSVWPEDRLFTPDDLRGSHDTLPAALAADGACANFPVPSPE